MRRTRTTITAAVVLVFATLIAAMSTGEDRTPEVRIIDPITIERPAA